MMLFKTFFRRIINDFRHKELLPLKLLFFVQASTLFVLYPYLTIHMRELGINVEETAIMSAVTPIVAIVMPPLAGMLADHIGNFKILLSLFSSLGGAAALMLLMVPVGRVKVQFPERVVLDLSCPGAGGDLVYTMSQTHPCDTSLQPEVATRIESCGYICHADLHNDTEVQAVLSSRSYTVRHYDLAKNVNSSHKYTISKADLPQAAQSTDDVREHRMLMNNEFYKTSIRRLSNSTYFFPTGQLYEFSCSESNVTENFDNSTVPNGNSTAEVARNEIFCTFGQSAQPAQNDSGGTINYHSYKSKLELLNATKIDVLENMRRYAAKETSWTGSVLQRTRCANPDQISQRIALTVPHVNHSVGPEVYKSLYIEGCSKRCIVTAPRTDICSNKEMEIEFDVRLTFWMYLSIRVFIGIIGGTAFAMFEGAVIAILREQKADYGLQRIYGSIGGMISSPLSGLLIDYASRGKKYTDFRPAFYLYAGLKIVSGILMLTINLEFKSPAANVVSDVMSVLKNIEVVALFITCFILGTAWGYIESFLFWLLQDLGGSRSLMGITITVGGIAGIPLLVMSGPIVERFGHANVLFIGFIFYAIRLLGYSLIYNPWMCLIFEALESVTSSLSFTAAVTYAAKLSTITTDSSMQGLLGGLYYGVGKGCGSLIGGYLMKAIGTRPTYQVFALLTLLTGCIYFLFNLLYLKKRPQVEGKDLVKKKPKDTVADGPMVEIDLTKKSEFPNDKIAYANDCKGYSPEKNEKSENVSAKTKEIEAIKNSKNLDKIEKMQDAERRENKATSAKREEEEVTSPEGRPVENGTVNLAFEASNDDGTCDVTIEKEPDDKK